MSKLDQASSHPSGRWRGRFRGTLKACGMAFASLPRAGCSTSRCQICAPPAAQPVASEGVCASCWSKLSFIAPPFCARLGIPFAYDSGPGLLSAEAIADPPAYARARAAVRYDEVARALVHGFKYQDRTDLAPMLGRWMARAGTELLRDADLIVPVPLHWRRGWGRRYNQSGALATVIGKSVAGRRRRRNPEAHPADDCSRSDCRAPSGRKTCRARSGCRTTENRT
jgi:predicted amidophosphoribosyltransferase